MVFGQLVLNRQDKLITSFSFCERSEYMHCDFVIRVNECVSYYGLLFCSDTVQFLSLASFAVFY